MLRAKQVMENKPRKKKPFKGYIANPLEIPTVDHSKIMEGSFMSEALTHKESQKLLRSNRKAEKKLKEQSSIKILGELKHESDKLINDSVNRTLGNSRKYTNSSYKMNQMSNSNFLKNANTNNSSYQADSLNQPFNKTESTTNIKTVSYLESSKNSEIVNQQGGQESSGRKRRAIGRLALPNVKGLQELNARNLKQLENNLQNEDINTGNWILDIGYWLLEGEEGVFVMVYILGCYR